MADEAATADDEPVADDDEFEIFIVTLGDLGLIGGTGDLGAIGGFASFAAFDEAVGVEAVGVEALGPENILIEKEAEEAPF